MEVVLRPDRDRSLRRRHPWILSGSVASAPEGAGAGAWVRVLSASGDVLGFGDWSPHSQIRVRMLSFGKDELPGDWLEQRIREAVARRTRSPLVGETNALRLVNAEGDGLPGLVADRYGDHVVVRLTSAGMAARRDAVAHALRQATGAGAGFERADAAAARREGVAVEQGPLWGEAPREPIEMLEEGRRYTVDLVNGQKTGFYLDQRDARDLVERVAERRRVLDLFAYTGGFSVAAAQGGAASLTLVESSSEALALARRNLDDNAPDLSARLEASDAFEFVRRGGETYDLIVIDPPPLARRRRDVAKASRAYKDVILHGLRRAAPDALLLAFACSHHVGPDLFRKIVFGASLDAARPVRVLRTLGAPADHPVALDHPEGAYLTGLLLET
jgi:23S rRNA (cytosine1962-C5)-methyltransferase